MICLIQPITLDIFIVKIVSVIFAFCTYLRAYIFTLIFDHTIRLFFIQYTLFCKKLFYKGVLSPNFGPFSFELNKKQIF